jgi:drug/metabolite transporter (DMT)-like permease
LGGSALVGAAAIGWGTWPFFLKQAERAGPIPPALEASASMLALTLVGGLLVSRDRLRVRAGARDWAKIVLLGVSDALNVVFFFAAYQRTSVAIAVLTHYLTPMLVAVAAPWVTGERWRARTFVAVFISLAGLVLLLAPWSAERHAADFVGGAFGVASAVCYATNVLVAKRLVPVFAGSEMSFYHGLIALLVLALMVPSGALSHVGAHEAVWLSVGALVPGALCGLLFIWGLRSVRASHASNLTLLEPLVATLGASVALHEPLSAPSVFGGGLVLVGAAIAVTGGRTAGVRGRGDPDVRVGAGLRIY